MAQGVRLEVNSKLARSAWRIHRYAEGAEGGVGAAGATAGDGALLPVGSHLVLADTTRSWGVGVHEEAGGTHVVKMVHLGGDARSELPPSAALWQMLGEPPRGAARVGVGGVATVARAFTFRHVATGKYLCAARPGQVAESGLTLCGFFCIASRLLCRSFLVHS